MVFSYLLICVILFLLIYIYKLKASKWVGTLVISRNEEGIKLFSLELDQDPEDIEKEKSVSFRVESQDLHPL